MFKNGAIKNKIISKVLVGKTKVFIFAAASNEVKQSTV